MVPFELLIFLKFQPDHERKTRIDVWKLLRKSIEPVSFLKKNFKFKLFLVLWRRKLFSNGRIYIN